MAAGMAGSNGRATFELVIRGHRILTAEGWLDGFIGVREGRIALLGARDSPEPVAADETIDAGAALVLPGLVDTHAHMRDPGFTHKEDWAHGSRAAAIGGVTTVLDMPNVEPPPSTVERLVAHRGNAARQAVVDFGHHAAATIPDEIPGLAAAGASGFKVFMKRDVARDYPHMPGTAVDDHARLFEICEAVATTGKPLLVHPDDQALAELFARRAWEREGRDFRAYARALRAGDGVTLDVGIATMLELQRATGVRLHVLHVSTPGGWALIRAAKSEGRPVTAEVNPFHLTVVNDWGTIEKWGPYALGSWIPPAHSAATWEAVNDGTADLIGSDHTPHARGEKEPGWTDMFATPGGSPTIQHYLSLLLSAVDDGRLTVERLVELCASAPARLVGLAGIKGAIELGADADIVVVDAHRRATIRSSEVLSKCGWTILDGREVVGVPIATIVRGRIVARDGVVTGPEGGGRSVGDRSVGHRAVTRSPPASPQPSPTAPRSLWLPGDGVRVHALDWGPVTGAAGLVLMLHGVAGNAWVWEPVASRLRDAIGDRCRIVAVDGRDGGLTDHPTTGYEVERFGADLVAVHDALGGGPLTLVGHSRGGWLAAWFAERHPDRMEHLVLVDPARLIFGSEADAERFYTWVLEGLGPFASRRAAVGWARKHDPDADWNAARTHAFMAGLSERKDGSLVGLLPPSAVDQLRAARQREDVVGPQLASIACPVMLMVASRQPDARRRDKLAYAERLLDVRVTQVDGTHFLHTDAPDRVADLIASFVESPQAAAAIPSSRRP